MKLRFLAQQAIRSLGYDIRRVPSSSRLEIKEGASDPVTYEYSGSVRGSVVFKIPVADCRGFQCLGLQLRPTEHPFVRGAAALLRGENEEENLELLQRALAEYYASVRPTSALEALALSVREAPGLLDVPAFGYLLPWWDRTVSDTIRGRAKSLKYVGMRYGISAGMGDGHTFFGPVTASKLSLEQRRLQKLIASVRRRGFQPFARDFPTKVVALRKKGTYRWLIEEGEHRFAVGAALAVRAIPAMVTMVVRRDDAGLWPQVVTGVFTKGGALSLFDRIFDGDAPPICRQWRKLVSGQALH